jgi:hypothetical protein
MTNIKTLIKDIYDVVGRSEDNWFSQALAEDFSRELGLKIMEKSGPRNEVPTLRLSQMGKKCPRSLWCSIHTPELAQPLNPWTKIQFSFGDIYESLVISMAKAAGHEVTGEQDALYVDGVRGHRDCVIDGNVVDVKSCSPLSFEKIKSGSIRNDDAFGYLDQLDGYVYGSRDDDLVRNKDSGFLLAINKVNGMLALYEHIARKESIRERVRDYRHVVSLSEPPECTCETIPDGKSGNIRLGVTASYNAFKFGCHPQLRTFLYAEGPRYLTKVVRRPTRQDGSLIPEVDKHGKLVYN